MSRLVKIVNNKYIQIEEYRNPNICFNTNEYNDFEDYCTLRETFDPFEIFYENKELKDNWNKLKKYIKETKLKEFEKSYNKRFGKTFTQAELIVCNMILDKMQELEQGSDSNE